jgi:hypothetical protein
VEDYGFIRFFFFAGAPFWGRTLLAAGRPRCDANAWEKIVDQASVCHAIIRHRGATPLPSVAANEAKVFAIGINRINRRFILAVVHERHGFSALGVGAIDVVADRVIARVVIQEFVTSAEFPNTFVKQSNRKDRELRDIEIISRDVVVPLRRASHKIGCVAKNEAAPVID